MEKDIAADLMSRVFLLSRESAMEMVFGESPEWDSLRHAEVLMEIEDVLDRALSDEEARTVVDYASIALLVEG